MPYINGRGDFCHGVGGGYFNINNVAIMLGGAMGWMDDDTAAFANGRDVIYGDDWCASKYHVPTGVTTQLSNPPTGSNVGFAGGGHAAWWWGPYRKPPEIGILGGLSSTTGFHSLVAGLMGVGPDGSIGYKPDYQSNGPTMVRELDGSEWQLTPYHSYDLQLLGQRRAIFKDTVLGMQVRGIPTTPTFLPGGVWAAYAFELQGKWWVGYYSGGSGLVAHPFDSFTGWSIVPHGDAWGAFRVIDNKLRVVWSNGQAEQAGQLTALWLDPAVNPLVDLTPPAHSDVPPPHSDVPPPHSDTPPPHSDVPPPHSDVPPPLPPLRTAERYWFGPNINSVDMHETVKQDLSKVDVYTIPVQHVLEDARYDSNRAAGFFKKLRATSTPLAIEMGSIKPEDWHADKAISDLSKVQQRVLAAGHSISYLSQDEPLTSAALRPEQPFSESVFAVAKFIEAARAEMPHVKVGWLEAWPNIDLETMRKFLMGLDSWGARLDYWHLDIDWHRAVKEHKDAFATIARAKQYADDYKMPLGVFFACYDHATDEEAQKEVLQLTHDALPNHTDIDHICIQSWALRTGTNVQDLPANLGQFGLLETFKKVQQEWQ